MASLFADENVRFSVVVALRDLGHDVLTALEDGRANQGIPDPEVLLHATALGRAVLTWNRRHFHKLHEVQPDHAGIVTYSDDPDNSALAQRIHQRITALATLAGQLVKVTRAG